MTIEDIKTLMDFFYTRDALSSYKNMCDWMHENKQKAAQNYVFEAAKKIYTTMSEKPTRFTLLHWACLLEQSTQTIEQLIPSNNINAAYDGLTALHIATEFNLIDVVRCLLKNGAVPSVSESGETPLSLAIKNDNPNLIQIFLAQPIPECWQNKSNIFERLIKKKQQALFKLIIDKDVAIDDMKWLLDQAIHYDCEDIVKTLLAKGADVNEDENRYPDQSDNLHRAFPSSLMQACARGNKEIVKTLLAYKANPNYSIRKPDGPYADFFYPENSNALYIAVLYGHFDIANILIERGAEPSLLHDPQLQLKSLFISAKSGNLEGMIYLIETLKVDINSINADGDTPLLLAHQRGHKDLAKYLISKGADRTVLTTHTLKSLSKHFTQLNHLITDYDVDLQGPDTTQSAQRSLNYLIQHLKTTTPAIPNTRSSLCGFGGGR